MTLASDTDVNKTEQATTTSGEPAPSGPAYLDCTVVYLLNFLAPDAIAICQNWAKQVREFIVLVSVSMEGNRAWDADDGGLDVRVQRTWTRTRHDHHPGGYSDVNYVHVPLDTLSQLRRAKPDVVVSAELGMRTILAALHCMKSGWFGLRGRRSKLVIAVSTSPWIEASRSGWLRTQQRCWLLRRADHVTYHGPQCRDWLLSLGVREAKLSPFQYAADPTKIYRGELISSGSSDDESVVRMITVGQLIDRKGIREGLAAIQDVAKANSALKLRWSILGGGPLLETLQAMPCPANLEVEFRGNCTAEQIRDAYRDHELMFFPTLGDEWGLVVDEALHSGLVVIGNDRAQSIVTLIREGENGWVYDLEDSRSLASPLLAFANLSSAQRRNLRELARDSVVDRTPQVSAEQIAAVIGKLI